MPQGVPASVEELITGYDRFIFWAIRRFSRHTPLSEEEVLDLRQMIYLRVIERDFLSRCRLYYLSHEGRFITSLSALVRNVLRNAWKRKQTDALATAHHLEDYTTLPDPFHFTGRIEAADILDKLGRRLHTGYARRRVQISEVFEAALAVGDPCPLDIAAHLHMSASTVRSHMAAARRAARRFDDDALSTPAV